MPSKWWKQPIIMAVLMTALGVIRTAFVPTMFLKKRQPEQPIPPQPYRNGSPAPTNTGGNANVDTEEKKQQ